MFKSLVKVGMISMLLVGSVSANELKNKYLASDISDYSAQYLNNLNTVMKANYKKKQLKAEMLIELTLSDMKKVKSKMEAQKLFLEYMDGIKQIDNGYKLMENKHIKNDIKEIISIIDKMK